MSEEKRESHPAYGMVSFHRSTHSHGCKLFGSQTRPHTSITLVIKPAEVIHDLSYDSYRALAAPLIEVRLSPSQFAELLTTMNVGDGVPCTIIRAQGKSVPEIPEDSKVEVEKIQDGFKDKMKGLGDQLNEVLKNMDTLLSGEKSLNKTNLREVGQELAMAVQEIRSNFPFVLEQFNESAQKIVLQAKAEVDAFATHAIQTAGLQALRGVSVPALESKE